MSRAVAQLRICDAYGNRKLVLPLDRDFFEIGGDGARRGTVDYVHLSGSGVEPRHAQLIKGDGGWRILPLTHAGARIGRREVANGASTPVSGGDEIWLGNNLLQILDISTNVTATAVNSELADIEMITCQALLDYEDRRRDLFNGEEGHRATLLSQELDRLMAQELKLAGKPEMIGTIDRYCAEALRRPLISACLMSGMRGTVDLAYSRLNPDHAARAVELREELASELGLRMTAEATAADLGLIHTSYHPAYRAISNVIGETLKLALIHDAVREKVMNLFFRLGPIQFLVDIPVISEIMVCNHRRIFVEKMGRIFETGLTFASETELFTIAARIAGRDGKQLTEGNPMADARLPDGSRSNIVASPTALDGISLTIRKFGNVRLTMPMLRQNRMMTRPMERLLEACVKARKNIIVSGGTGSGKTTLLNALSMFIPDEERVVTIEDTAELRLINRNLVRLESRRANMDGRGEISIRDLVRNALRMRPDRIVVGECRGGETLDMLQAMNTGHSGSMTTAHANSPRDLILRLETMVMQSGEEIPIHAIRQQIAAAIDIIVQVSKTASMAPGAALHTTQRTIVEIAELGEFDPDTGEIEVSPIFELSSSGGRPRHVIAGYIPTFFDDMADRNLISIDTFFDDREAHHAG